jgi:transcriptional regulator with XRE-family HTH domain
MPVWRDSIRALIAERGMTRHELAQRAGLARSTVLHVLKGGHCSTETLERIARALGVDVGELFTPPLDLGHRRDRMIAALLRELSETVSAAVMADLQHRRRRHLGAPRRGDRRLPFSE